MLFLGLNFVFDGLSVTVAVAAALLLFELEI
jgi:hypothetical protein